MRKQIIRIATAFLLAAGLCCSCNRGQVTLVDSANMKAVRRLLPNG